MGCAAVEWGRFGVKIGKVSPLADILSAREPLGEHSGIPSRFKCDIQGQVEAVFFRDPLTAQTHEVDVSALHGC